MEAQKAQLMHLPGDARQAGGWVRAMRSARLPPVRLGHLPWHWQAAKLWQPLTALDTSTITNPVCRLPFE
jgi:hypothetical protein